MQRNVRPALLALLAVLAVALGAATLQSAVVPTVGSDGGDPSGIGGDGGDFGVGGQNRTSGNATGTPLELQFDAWCVPFLQTDAFAALFALVALLAAAVIYRTAGPLYVGAAAAVAFVPGVVGYLLLTDCGPTAPLTLQFPFFGPGQNGTIFSGPAGGAGGAPAITPAAIVLLAVFAVGVAVALLRATDDDPAAATPDDSEPPSDPDATLADVGAAAGAAADRIDAAADVENEVFRAWREMTTHLDVSNPAASTPAEFAAAACEAGMDGADVDALTDLFREVRYGGEQPTADREKRAVAALRSIERAYAHESLKGGDDVSHVGGVDDGVDAGPREDEP